MERQKRIQEATDLEKLGWKSTGDIPFALQRTLHKHPSNFERDIVSVLQSILEVSGPEYELANVKRLGVKTFCSPDAIEKLEEVYKDRLSIRRKVPEQPNAESGLA